jgi:hypothetical protein
MKKNQDILKLYAEKKAERAKVDSELDELEPQVLGYLNEKGFDTLREDYGTFSVVYRKKWSYTNQLVEKEKQYAEIIKTAKLDEQDSGEAKAEEVKGLSYREYKPDYKGARLVQT